MRARVVAENRDGRDKPGHDDSNIPVEIGDDGERYVPARSDQIAYSLTPNAEK
jgi:hypothetical protein